MSRIWDDMTKLESGSMSRKMAETRCKQALTIGRTFKYLGQERD